MKTGILKRVLFSIACCLLAVFALLLALVFCIIYFPTYPINFLIWIFTGKNINLADKTEDFFGNVFHSSTFVLDKLK